MMDDGGKSSDKLRELEKELDSLKTENRELREELQETSQGTLALYSEIDSKNEELSRHKSELEKKNEDLATALTNLQESEAARLKAAKTAAMGTMVITYNHEINNPLSIILNAIQVLKLKNEKLGFLNEETLNYLAKIENAAERIRDVVAKIREYESLLPTEYLDGSSMLDLHAKGEKADSTDTD